MATKTERKNEWNTKNYDRIAFVVKAGDRAKIQAAADAEGLSVNRFIHEAINAKSPGLLSPLDDTSKQKKQTELAESISDTAKGTAAELKAADQGGLGGLSAMAERMEKAADELRTVTEKSNL